MPIEPDLRASKMESSEGRGVARARWLNWWASLPEDFRDAIGPEIGPERVQPPFEEAPPTFGADWAKDVREQSELIGFWIAWHQAGGFRALELSGWNRATIYRKLKQFRTAFGAHPDEHDFDWITLDLSRSWFRELGVELKPAPTGKSKRRS